MSEAVLAAYAEAATHVGNPSSIHQSGQDARAIVENARAAIAGALGVDPMQVEFTSGGTEASNLFLKGRTFQLQSRGVSQPVWLATRAEHHATLDALQWLEDHGEARVHWLDVDDHARMGLDSLDQALAEYPSDDIAGVTTLVGNNEVGSIQPVEQIIASARRAGVAVHLDAIQAFGHIPLDLSQWRADAVTISAHKIGGPVGIGALVVSRDAAAFEPLHHGGGQQNHRSGTLDAAGAAAFAEATRRAVADLEAEQTRLAALSERLRQGLCTVEGVVARGAEPRLPHICHVTIDGVDGDVVLFVLDADGIRVSTGSACQAGVSEPSHVLLAMGLSDEVAESPIRFSLGRDTTDEDIDRVLEVFSGAVSRARTAGRADTSEH